MDGEPFKKTSPPRAPQLEKGMAEDYRTDDECFTDTGFSSKMPPPRASGSEKDMAEDSCTDEGCFTDAGLSSEPYDTNGRKVLSLSDQLGILSIGSMKHATGNCAPCAFFHTNARGCVQGRNCTFCHMCPPSRLKVWKKERQQWKRLVDNQKNSNHLATQSENIQQR